MQFICLGEVFFLDIYFNGRPYIGFAHRFDTGFVLVPQTYNIEDEERPVCIPTQSVGTRRQKICQEKPKMNDHIEPDIDLYQFSYQHRITIINVETCKFMQFFYILLRN